MQREFDLGLVISAPSVKYKLGLRDGTTIDVDNPSYWPDPTLIDSTTEPYIKAAILIPEEYVGPVMELCREHRSDNQTMNYLSAGRVEVTSEMPLGEVLFTASRLAVAMAEFADQHSALAVPNKTSGISIHPTYRHVDNEEPRISGYSASNTVNLKVRDIAALARRS